MKIKDAKIYVCSPGRNFVTLKISTDTGIYGLGDATLNGREMAVASYLTEHVIPCLIDKDPFQIEDIWQYLYRGSYWRGGPVTMTAIAAVDMALWDIKGKVLETPVYNLLGGKSRKAILAYIHASGIDIEEAINAVGIALESGFHAVRVQCGVPGIAKIYGVPTENRPYEPAQKGLPSEEFWSTEKYLNFIPKLFDKIRLTHGNDVHILHDAHHRLTAIEAARLGKILEPYHLFWLEDPVTAELQEGYRLIRQHTTTPLAAGEVLNSIWEAKTLITEQLVDYIRISVLHGGGISHLQKIANFAELYNVRIGCHGATDLSPITMAAALHLNISINNFGIQEFMPHSDLTNNVFPHSYFIKDGYFYLDEISGLGVDFDETFASKYPYERAYLPVNRKTEGTMFNW